MICIRDRYYSLQSSGQVQCSSPGKQSGVHGQVTHSLTPQSVEHPDSLPPLFANNIAVDNSKLAETPTIIFFIIRFYKVIMHLSLFPQR